MEQMKITEMEALINRNYKNICGMNVLKNGVSVYEAYFQGCTSESRMHVYSVTKSIVLKLSRLFDTFPKRIFSSCFLHGFEVLLSL